MQKLGFRKLWQLVGTRVYSQYTAKPKGGFRIASTALALPILCLVASNRVAAQIKPDTTLPRNSIVTPQGNTIKIDGGTQAGSNLFHSFSQFSVPTGGTAFFNNAAGISNIFSRVTGGFVSNIDGILKANGTANLFLINPNGIIFGPNAQLNIGGSFVATTANAIQFGTQGVFSASVPNSPSLLTVNPSAFLFNQIAAQGTNSIENSGDLEVNPGKSLLLVGGNISPTASETGGILIDGMNSRINLNPNGSDLELIPTGNGVLKAQGGAIAIGGLAAPGAIGLNIDTNNPDLMSLNFPSGISRVDVSLVNAAALYVAGGGGGSITINARNFNMSGGSVLDAGIVSQLGPSSVLAGDIIIDATNLISLDSSDINDDVSSRGVGNGGNLTITGRTLSVTNGAQLGANTFGQGNAGNLTISASDGISFDGERKDGYPSGAFSTVQPGAVGNGGNLTITGRTLSVTNGAELSAGTFGQGNAGNLTISARDGISFDGESKDGYPDGAFSSVESGAVGNGGNLTITGRTISVTNGAELSASTFGHGNSGNVTISARDGISFDGEGKDGYPSGAFSQVNPGAVGNGGNLTIAGRTLSVTNGARLSAGTLGHGNSGNLTISAIDGISFDGEAKEGYPSGAFSQVNSGAVGNGGNLTIAGRTLSVTNGARLSARTLGQGDAGNLDINVNTFNAAGASIVETTTSTNNRAGDINITAGEKLTFSDSNTGIFASTNANSTGNGGNVSIAAPQLTIRNGAQVTAQSQGKGNAGDILNIQANSLTLDNGSITTTSPSGNGGNINNIQVRDLLLLRNNSKISTSAGTQSSGGGNGGNITINAPFIVAPAGENSNIIANAFQGNGGNIQINSQSLFGIESRPNLTLESDINASSKFGQSGIVQINTPTVNPTQGLLALPTTVVDASTLIAKNCSEAVGENQFIITGRGGLPPNPDDALSSDTVWEDTHSSAPTANQQRISAATTTKASAATARIISPATGWVFNDKGEIMLVATAPASSFYNPWLNATTCHAK